jgi:hypothetical protein
MIFSLGKTSGFHGTNVCQHLRKSNDLGVYWCWSFGMTMEGQIGGMRISWG